MKLGVIDDFLDGITMYRLLLYYLIGLLVAAFGLGAFGDLPYTPLAIAGSALILTGVCWLANKVFAYAFAAPTNVDSTYITALILALIIAPAHSGRGLLFLLAAGILATASKYILAIHKKHLFNPAAAGVVLTALGAGQTANWWVGTGAMLPFVLIGGVLLVRKIRRARMVLTFLIVAILTAGAYAALRHAQVATILHETIFSSSLFFLAFVMLSEPLTSPPTAGKQVSYAALAGLLFPPQVHIFSLYSTPELVLIVSNLFAYVISPKTKLFPVLKEKLKVANDSFDFVFRSGQQFAYQPGQYMEWTLPHPHTDARGNRRYFSLASSPTESEIRIGVKFYKQGSSYKQALLKLDSKTPIVASQIAGDFVLPKDHQRPLVFIAGGIGITPYRGMVKYLLDKRITQPVTLLYSAKTANDIAYREIFEKARQQIDLNAVYTLTEPEAVLPDEHYRRGYIDAELIRNTVPDYASCLFYISGTHSMVSAIRGQLNSLGVPHHQIKVDFFPGYV